jgi:biopolymer transport protein ExbB
MAILELIKKGGPVMWPLILTSVVSVAVVLERLLFIVREKARRKPEAVDQILKLAQEGKLHEASKIGLDSTDFVARTLSYGLANRDSSYANALLRAANKELKRFAQGVSVLDTVITLAPLLGLFGTVTGMIHSFGLLGGAELEAPSVITGGIAEALIATAFGLVIAMLALIPFNYLNARAEEARHEIEDASNHLELLLLKPVNDRRANTLVRS